MGWIIPTWTPCGEREKATAREDDVLQQSTDEVQGAVPFLKRQIASRIAQFEGHA
jgi:hypothetical protein